MSKELIQRLITSILILNLTIFSIYLGGLVFKLFLLLIFFLSLIEWKNLSNNLVIFFLGLILLFLAIMAAYILRYDDLYYLIFVLIISISSDIGGYIFGKLIGGPKLTQISPNKTYAGMFGSYLLSILFSILYLNFYYNLFIFETFSLFTFSIVLLISSLNQIGDIIISYFKRAKNIKNTGEILPGHGGVLDRIDGIIFVIPFSYVINIFFL